MQNKSSINSLDVLHLVVEFGFQNNNPPKIRILSTNAIESLNMSLRKILKNRASFPNDDSALKLLYLSLNNISKKRTIPSRYWGKVVQQLAVKFEGRAPL